MCGLCYKCKTGRFDTTGDLCAAALSAIVTMQSALASSFISRTALHAGTADLARVHKALRCEGSPSVPPPARSASHGRAGLQAEPSSTPRLPPSALPDDRTAVATCAQNTKPPARYTSMTSSSSSSASCVPPRRRRRFCSRTMRVARRNAFALSLWLVAARPNHPMHVTPSRSSTWSPV